MENKKIDIEAKKEEIKKELGVVQTEKIVYEQVKLEPETLQWYTWIRANCGYPLGLSDFVNESVRNLFNSHYKLELAVIANSGKQIVAHEEEDESKKAEDEDELFKYLKEHAPELRKTVLDGAKAIIELRKDKEPKPSS